jgi:uncharacterized protein DUF2680
MSKTIKIVVGIVGGIVVVALLIGAALFGVHAVAAQDGTPSTSPASSLGAHGPKDHAGLGEFMHESVEEAQASALGMTDAELHAAILSGKTIRDLVEEKGIAPEDFRTTMQTARKDAIQQAVEKGLITQEQADRILQRMDQRPHDGKHGPRPNSQPGDNQPSTEPQG